MPLDFALLGADGSPTNGVSIHASLHERMTLKGISLGTRLLLRTNDFYADAEFTPTEVPSLLAEVRAMQRATNDDAELSAFLLNLCDLIDRALRNGVGITAIAD